MAASFSGCPANQSPFIIKFFKRLLNRRRLDRPARSRGRVAGFYGLSLLTAYLTLGLFLCSILAAPQALAGQTITIGGNVSHDVTGNGTPPDGTGYAGDPNNNTVVVNSGRVYNHVSGGYTLTFSGPAAVSGNSVAIYGGIVSGGSIGGQAIYLGSGRDTATATGNSVTINDGTVNYAQGGVAETNSTDPASSARSSGNSITINGGTVNTTASGGRASGYGMGQQFTSSENSVTINNGTVNDAVYGGWADGACSQCLASGNSVTIYGGAVNSNVYGGYALGSGTATASGNRATVNGGTISGGINGGYGGSVSSPATVSGNSVTINGGTINADTHETVSGNYVNGGYAKTNGPAAVFGNSVKMNGGTVNASINGGFAQSGGGTATAKDNNVSTNGGIVVGDVKGGFAQDLYDGTATAAGNSAGIYPNSTVGGAVYGGYAESGDGTAAAEGNEAIIVNCTIGGNVYGGFAYSGSGNARATDNRVGINYYQDFGTNTIFYGGYASSLTGAATAVGNTVDAMNISGRPNFRTNTTYGGFAESVTGTATTTGNTATIHGHGEGISVAGDVYGGAAKSVAGTATAEGNTADISGGTVDGDVFGGFAETWNDGTGTATATDNSVALSDSTVRGAVHGGSARADVGTTAMATNNVVDITGGLVAKDVLGGAAFSYMGASIANGNEVAVNGGTAGGDVLGGLAEDLYGGTAMATDNSVAMNGGIVGESVLGGYAKSGDGTARATDNSVAINGGRVVYGNVLGGFAESGAGKATAEGNKVAIVNGSSLVWPTVYGGYALSSGGNAKATDNAVYINTGSTVSGDVFGGAAESGAGTATAEGNAVTINTGSTVWDVFGGAAVSGAGSATAEGNAVAISGSMVGWDVYGGYAIADEGNAEDDTIAPGFFGLAIVDGGKTARATVTNNSVDIAGGKVEGFVRGGYAGSGGGSAAAEGNRAAISGGSEGGLVYGGEAESGTGTATAVGNVAAINDRVLVGQVFGGVANSGGTAIAADNEAIITDSRADGGVWGGSARSGVNAITTGNVATFFGSTADDLIAAVTGGEAVSVGAVPGSVCGIATATGNAAIIADSRVRNNVNGGLAASDGTATAVGNEASIYDSTVGGNVHGGWVRSNYGSALASSNVTTLFGGTVGGEAYGGFSSGSYGSALATGNTISLAGGTVVRSNVYGGYAYSGNGSMATGNIISFADGSARNIYGGYAESSSGSAMATGNTSSFFGGTVGGNVYGGYAYSGNGTALATDNTVEISGNPDFGKNTIYGGLAYSYGGAYFGDSFSGNTLYKNSPVNIQNVKNFEYINFGHGGQAGIANLDTTPTGSARPGVVLKTSTTPLDFTGVIYGSGALAKTGAGTLTLSGANTYTGLTEVQEGTLALAGAGRISNSLALYNQTTFDSGGKNLTLNSLEVKNLAGASSAANLKAPSVVIGPQGTVDVGVNTLNIGGSLSFTGGADSIASTYKLAGNGQNTGRISVSGQAQIGEGAKLAYTGSFANLTGKTILTAARFNDGTYFKNPLLTFQFRDYADHTDLVVTGQRNIEDVTNSISPGGNSTSAGAVIQGMPYSELKNKLLLNVQDFALADDPAQGEKALRQFIGEGSLNAVNAHYDTVSQMASALDGRVQTLLEGRNAPAAGSGPTENRLWLKPFGQWNRQDDENGALGYRYHSGGLMLGYDREMAQPGLTLGLYGAVSKGFLENDLAETDIQTTGLGLYGLYEFGGGYFADLNFGYGHSNIDSASDLVFGGRKTSKFSTDSFQTGLNFGRVFQLSQEVALTPSAGLRYTHVKQNGWQEKIVSDPDNKVVANWFGDSRQDFLEIPLNLKLATTFETVGGAAVTPDVHFGGIIAANHPKSELRMGFVGSDESTTISGLAPGRSRLTTGAGVKSQLSETLDISVNYDLEFRKGYQGHSAYAVLGVSF